MYTPVSAAVALRERGVDVSPSTLSRLIREQIITRPAIVGGYHVWPDAALDQLEAEIRAYRAAYTAARRATKSA